MKKILFVIMLLFVSLASISCSNPSTPAGHEGYVFEDPRIFGSGGFQGAITGPGNFGVSLWRNEVENVDFRPQTYTEGFRILAKDELNIGFRFQTIIKVRKGTIRRVVEEFSGAKFYEKYIHEPLRSAVRENVQPLNSRAVKAQRIVIAKAVMKKMQEYLKDTPFILISAVVGNINYPDVVTKAVEKKLAAKQKLEEKETQREIAKKDAEIRIEEAKGIAEAQRIINATLTKNYLQHEAISAQKKMANSPNHTTVYIPSGANGIPVIRNLR